MPLFSNKHQHTTQAHPAPSPAGRSSMSSNGSRHGIFSRHRSSSSSDSDIDRRSSNRHSMVSKRDGLFHRHQEDPSIASARERVVRAERAEQEADRALVAARASVREAKEHVRQLELEAKEDARLAKIKQQQAGQIGKRAKPLGRKF